MTPDGRITSEFDDTAIIEPEDDDELADLELVVLDLFGTTVIDDGLVERAFARAVEGARLAGTAEEHDRALASARQTMGRPASAVFEGLTDDDDHAQHAGALFESAFAELVAADGVHAAPGAEELIRLLRDAGVAVALTSGLSRSALDLVIAALGWGDLADTTVSADEAGRGRPFPDQPLTALLRTGATTVEGMVVVGGSASDIASGIAAGAGLVVGVLSGTDDERAFFDAGADAVVDGVADLAELLGFEDEDAAFDDEDDDLADFDDEDELDDDVDDAEDADASGSALAAAEGPGRR